MKRVFIKILTVPLLLILSFAIIPQTTTFASSPSKTMTEYPTVTAPSQRYHEVVKITVSPGPASIQFYDTIDGYFYKGTLNKISQQYNPEIGYITTYGGIVKKV